MKQAPRQTVEGTQADKPQCRHLLYKCFNFSEMKLTGDFPMVRQAVPVEICISRGKERELDYGWPFFTAVSCSQCMDMALGVL